MENITIKINTENVLLNDWSRALLFEYVKIELFELIEYDAPFIKSYSVQDENISYKFYHEYLFELLLTHLDFEKLIQYYNETLVKLINKHIQKSPEDLIKTQQYFVQITIPRVAKLILTWIKRDSRFYLNKKDKKFFEAFKESIIKLNNELFSIEIQKKKTNTAIEQIYIPTTINTFLEDVFVEYEIFAMLFKGEVIPKELIDKIKKFKPGKKVKEVNMGHYQMVFERNDKKRILTGKDNFKEASFIIAGKMGYDKGSEKQQFYKRFHAFKKTNNLKTSNDFEAHIKKKSISREIDF